MSGCAIIIGHGPGVGEATARAFGALGLDVALIARSGDKVRAAAAAMAADGVRAEGFAADAGDEQSLLAALEAAQSALGVPSVVLYNAAFWRPGPVLAVRPDEFVDDYRTCVVGALVAARWAVPLMGGAGSILLTGGGLALHPSPQAPTLSIGKGAIRALAFMLAEELSTSGIAVGTVTIAGPVGATLTPQRVADALVSLHERAAAGIVEVVVQPVGE